MKKSRAVKLKLPAKVLIFLIIFAIFGGAILYFIVDLVKTPFVINNKNNVSTVIDTVNVSKTKIEFVKKSYMQILPNSFWDHVNYVDTDYSKYRIGTAVNNVLGYDEKKIHWFYKTLEDNETEIISARGYLTLNNVRYQAFIKFNIVDNKQVFFYDLSLREIRVSKKFSPATQKLKCELINLMFH